MKYGILQAIADCRLRDALRLLEQCRVTKPVEIGHGCIINALLHPDDAYDHAVIAKCEMSRWPADAFQREQGVNKPTMEVRYACDCEGA